jgi:CheY-like chemotaxis protein
MIQNGAEMHQYLVAKILFIQSVADTITEGLRLEHQLSPFLPDGLLLDITVVRECMTGLEQLKFSLYDAIFVDSDIDFLTGQEFVRILRVLGDDIPVLLITEPLPQINLQSYASQHGFSSVLVKPISPQALVNGILGLMEQPVSEPQKERQVDGSIICN